VQVSNLEREEVFFVDIGANVGWFTINAAAMGYSVIAFEPTTSNASWLSSDAESRGARQQGDRSSSLDGGSHAHVQPSSHDGFCINALCAGFERQG
jgi:2-polyprenyl-3-methyl-5-hydroxy-6-metoxy-1,4-benzoquinol methylase